MKNAIFCAACLFCMNQYLWGAERGETARLLTSLKDDAEASLKVARTERDFFTATSALSYYLSATATLTSEEAIKDLASLAKNEELQRRLALLLALEKDGSAIAEKCQAAGAPALAAEIVLAQARLREAGKDINESLRLQNDQGKVVASKVNLVSPKPPALPPAWLDSRDPVIQESLLVAAALLEDASLLPAVQAVEPASIGGKAAQIWARTALGDKPPTADLASAIQAVNGYREDRSQPGPELSDGSLLDHPLCYLLRAMARDPDESSRPFVARQLLHPDLRVQQEAVKTLEIMGAGESLRELLVTLERAHGSTVIPICEALRTAPSKEAFVPLIKRLQMEKGQLRLHLVYTLSALAGGNHGATAEEWITWYRGNVATLEIDPARTAEYLKENRVHDVRVPSLGSFYGLPIFSNALTFVVDSSGSMKGDRITSLQQNLAGTIRTMKTAATYNIVDFGADITRLSDRGLINDEKKTMRYLEEIKLTGATRSFEALETGALDDIEALYFLSDGAPARSQINTWGKIIPAWKVLYRHRPITLYMVVFDPNPQNRMAMDKFAAAFYGLTEAPH